MEKIKNDNTDNPFVTIFQASSESPDIFRIKSTKVDASSKAQAAKNVKGTDLFAAFTSQM